MVVFVINDNGSVEGIYAFFILNKVEIWTGVKDATPTLTTLKDRATQLLIKYKSGALVTQLFEK